MSTETSIAERIEKRHEAQRLAAWSALADVLRNKGKRSADDNAAKIAELAGILGIPIGELDEFNRVVREFDNLADADEQAAAAAEALEVASKAIEDHDHETEIVLEPLRQALDAKQQERAAGRAPLAQAASVAKEQATAAQRRKARRHDLAIENPDLLDTHREADEVAARIEEAKEVERQREREIAEADAVQGALIRGHLSDHLAGEIRRRVVDEVARTGYIRRHTVDPDFTGSPMELEPTYGDLSNGIKQEILDHREHLLRQLVAGEIGKAQAGRAVVHLGEYRGLILKGGHHRYVSSHNGTFGGAA